jgi:ribonuclease HI
MNPIMQLDPRALHIYTDGSCYRNPGGQSGCAAIAQFPDEIGRSEEQIVDWGTDESNISRMELMACVRAVMWLRANANLPVERVQIISDSKYVVDNVPRAHRWKKLKWRNTDNRPIDNHDLWKELLSGLSKLRLRVDFLWTPGKRSEILKRIDKAAKKAAKTSTYVDRGFRPGTLARSLVHGVATMFPASGKTAVIRPYRK